MENKAEKTNNGNGKPSKSALRRQREREKRYRTILQAAEILFAKEGYHQASIERIADQAEVSVGTVYFYFKNKEDILIQLLDEIGFHIRKRVGEEFLKDDVSMNSFKRAGMIFFEEICLRYPHKITIFFREAVGQSSLVEAHRKRLFDKIIADIKGAVERMGETLGFCYPSSFSTELMAVSIMGMYERIAYYYLIWQDRTDDLRTVAMDALNFIQGGIENLCKQDFPCS